MKYPKEFQKIWAQIVVKAWSDEKFKKRLMQNPKEVLKEFGIDTSKTEYAIIEDTESKKTLVMPKRPEGLSDEEMKKMNAANFNQIFINQINNG
jgi:hypothetical protein